MNYKTLNITLFEDCPFELLVELIKKAFNTNLQPEKVKGRWVARGKTNVFKIYLIDRIDELFDEPDKYHVLKIEPNQNYLSQEEFIEKEVIDILGNNNILWIRGIWAPVPHNGPYREIFPNKTM